MKNTMKNKLRRSPMKKNTLRRILCTVLCACLLLNVAALSTSAAAKAKPYVSLSQQPKKDDSDPLQSAVSFFFRNFGFIGFILDPYQFTIINQKPVFQWALGFNDLYDIFPFVMNVYADSVVNEFNYEGKDWRIQLWKGGYGVFLATGGEIGIYNKSEEQELEHYACPASQSDWMYLKYTIYNRGKALFTRPSPYLSGDEGPYWWCPGYKVLSICTDFLSSPRKNVIMDGTIEFKSNKMAQLFLESMKKKGFKDPKKGVEMTIKTPETIALMPDGKSVRFIWQNINESWY